LRRSEASTFAQPLRVMNTTQVFSVGEMTPNPTFQRTAIGSR
jgi:hypothetical protein